MRLEVPASLRFTCTRCGDCCRGWSVALGPGEPERIRALDWRGREPDLAGAATVVAGVGPDGARGVRLARTADDACVFLGARNQCRIQEHFGEAAKPLVCRLYPLRFQPAGDRVGVDAAFSCRSVSDGTGEPLERAVEAWRPHLERLDGAPPGRRHRLAPGRPLPAPVLWELVGHLSGLLGERPVAVRDRVRLCLEYLRLATTGDPATAAAATLRAVMARSLPRQLGRLAPPRPVDETQRSFFYLWLYLALNPSPPGLAEAPEGERRREALERAEQADRFRLREGRPRIDGRELAATFAEVAAVDPAPFRAGGDERVAAYLAAKLVGLRFLAAGPEELPFLEAAYRLMLAYPMALWTASALAAARGARASAEQDVIAALRLHDRSLDRISTAALDRAQAESWRFLMEETDLAPAVTAELLGERPGTRP